MHQLRKPEEEEEGKNLNRFLLPATTQCDKTHTKINTGYDAAVCEARMMMMMMMMS